MVSVALHSGERAGSASDVEAALEVARHTGVPLQVLRSLAEQLALRYPGGRLVAIEPLGPGTGATASLADKRDGYGRPLKLSVRDAGGAVCDLVWRVNTSNEFGHDRLADRAANTLLAREDFSRIPQHITALEAGAVTREGKLVPLPAGSELYLLTTYAPGHLYVEDLRRIAETRVAEDRDLARVDAIAAYLAKLHVPESRPHAYRRAIRDLVGHGEGIFGMIDGYPANVPAASSARLHAIEQRCAEWRWRLRDHEDRLARTHGDFHPFNIVFDDTGALTLLDASRGTMGDPADDLTALSVNYLLFALDVDGAWERGLAPLWRRFWSAYFQAHPDPTLLDVAPPFFAWRVLVVCNPRFYPSVSAASRDALLSLAERTLDAGRLDLAAPENLFR